VHLACTHGSFGFVAVVMFLRNGQGSICAT